MANIEGENIYSSCDAFSILIMIFEPLPAYFFTPSSAMYHGKAKSINLHWSSSESDDDDDPLFSRAGSQALPSAKTQAVATPPSSPELEQDDDVKRSINSSSGFVVPSACVTLPEYTRTSLEGLSKSEISKIYADLAKQQEGQFPTRAALMPLAPRQSGRPYPKTRDMTLEEVTELVVATSAFTADFVTFLKTRKLTRVTKKQYLAGIGRENLSACMISELTDRNWTKYQWFQVNNVLGTADFDAACMTMEEKRVIAAHKALTSRHRPLPTDGEVTKLLDAMYENFTADAAPGINWGVALRHKHEHQPTGVREDDNLSSIKGRGPANCRLVYDGFRRGAQSQTNNFTNIHLDGVGAYAIMRDGEDWKRKICVGNFKNSNLTFTTRTEYLIELMTGRVYDMKPPTNKICWSLVSFPHEFGTDREPNDNNGYYNWTLRATNLEKSRSWGVDKQGVDQQELEVLRHALTALVFMARTNTNYKSVFEEYPLQRSDKSLSLSKRSKDHEDENDCTDRDHLLSKAFNGILGILPGTHSENQLSIAPRRDSGYNWIGEQKRPYVTNEFVRHPTKRSKK
jgi:hypothetical protein